ncbi:MAG: hypothetical protein V4543_03900 [Bacteroidota bacterium]
MDQLLNSETIPDDSIIIEPRGVKESADILSWRKYTPFKWTDKTKGIIRHISNTIARVLITCWACWIVQNFLHKTLYIVLQEQEILKEQKTHLSDIVVITLLSTTTLNVLGLTYIILKGLFPTKAVKTQISTPAIPSMPQA